MIIKVFEENEITPALDQEIKDGLCQCFPDDAASFSISRAWHGSYPAYSVIMQDEKKIVAHVGIVKREISINDIDKLTVGGIQNVFVFSEYRGQGLVDAIMAEAMTVAAKKQFDCGFLFCVPELEKVYTRCLWNRLPDINIIRIDEAGNNVPIPGKNIAMFFPLKTIQFPPGDIYLQGNDW